MLDNQQQPKYTTSKAEKAMWVIAFFFLTGLIAMIVILYCINHPEIDNKPTKVATFQGHYVHICDMREWEDCPYRSMETTIALSGFINEVGKDFGTDSDYGTLIHIVHPELTYTQVEEMMFGKPIKN